MVVAGTLDMGGMIALLGESPKPGATERRNGSEAVVRNLSCLAHETRGDSGVTGIVTGALVPAPTGGDHDSTGDFPAGESDLRCSVVVRGLGGYARVPRMYGWRDRPFTNISWTSRWGRDSKTGASERLDVALGQACAASSVVEWRGDTWDRTWRNRALSGTHSVLPYQLVRRYPKKSLVRLRGSLKIFQSVGE